MRFDGDAWVQDEVRELSDGLNAVLGAGDGDVWVVGDEGTILRHR